MDYSQYIKPELLILIPVLLAVGGGLKTSTIIENRLIPLILGGIGIFLSALWVFGSSGPLDMQSGLTAVFTSIVQGILCAGGAVYGHQLFKQSKAK